MRDAFSHARQALKAELERKTYDSLAGELGVSKGALWKFVKTDYVPVNPELRKRLGLPELVIVPVKRDAVTGRYVPRDD